MPEHYATDLLAGQHIVVTGGGSGMGRVMAGRFATLGAQVSVCGRRREKLDETVAEIRAAGGQAHAEACDLRDPDAVEAFFAAVEDAVGPVTGLVNNAAGNFLAASEKLTPGGFDAVVRTNLYGTFYCTQACGRRWIERGGGGAVVSITATYWDHGSAFVMPSAASKAGIVSLTRSLAVEWGRHGIRLNAISPGPVPTEGAWSRLVPDAKTEDRLRQRVPLGRFGAPEEIAGVAVFLLSDLAAYISGEVLSVDGAERIASGGLFNELTRLPQEQLDALFASMRKRT